MIELLTPKGRCGGDTCIALSFSRPSEHVKAAANRREARTTARVRGVGCLDAAPDEGGSVEAVEVIEGACGPGWLAQPRLTRIKADSFHILNPLRASLAEGGAGQQGKCRSGSLNWKR